MATFNGREARVTVNASTTEALVAEISNWKIDMSAGEVDTTVFGDGWGKSDVGMKTWKGSMSGFFDNTDTAGQEVIKAAYLSGDLLADIRFYVQYTTESGEDNIYVAPDTASDANAGLRVTSLSIGTDKSGVATIDMSFSGSGPVKETTDTVA